MAKLVVSELHMYAWNMVIATTMWIDGSSAWYELFVPIIVDPDDVGGVLSQVHNQMVDNFNTNYSTLVGGDILEGEVEYI